MRYLIAIDSFKGSLTSLQAGKAVAEAVSQADKNATVTVRPLADGGEGTVDALCAGMDGRKVLLTVTGPLGEPVEAAYGILPDGTAVLEMSAAAGITLVPQQLRDPMQTTTYGVGEMIKDAVSRGCRRFLIGIGGSATNDGGLGMLQALGVAFLDAEGNGVGPYGKGLEKVAAIDVSGLLPQLKECTFRIACDVNNPLCGQRGCSAVYGPQKGADPETVAKMDSWLANYAKLVSGVCENADATYPGVGAAGGLGFAFMSFLPATLESGVEIILDETQLEKYIREADVVITGEGRLDEQTVMGKAPIGVAKLAKKYGKKVLAFSGCVTAGAVVCNEHGIDAYFPIVPGIVTLEEALDPENAYRNLCNTAYQVCRLLNL